MTIKKLLRACDWSDFRESYSFIRDSANCCPIVHVLGGRGNAVAKALRAGMPTEDVLCLFLAADHDLVLVAGIGHRSHRRACRLRRWMLAQIAKGSPA